MTTPENRIPSNAHTSTSKRPLVLLLLALIPLAGLMAWVFKHYNTSPFYPAYHFPRNASLAIWPDTGTIWRLTGTRAMCLDLSNGRLSSVQAGGDFFTLRDSRGIGYELGPAKEEGFTILARDGLSESTKVICHLPSYATFQTVHAERYLLELQTNQVVALDVQAVTSGEGSKMTLAACLFLTRSAIAYRIGWALGDIASVVLVVDPLMTLLSADIYLQFFAVMLVARVVALIYLLTAALLVQTTAGTR